MKNGVLLSVTLNVHTAHVFHQCEISIRRQQHCIAVNKELSQGISGDVTQQVTSTGNAPDTY
jgi:hypothetical protein